MKTLTRILLGLAFLASITVPAAAQVNSNIINSKPGIAYNANAVTVTTSTYTVQKEDHTVLVNATSAAATITLPPAGSKAFPFVVIKKVDSSTNTVTIDAAGSQTIDGATSVVLRNQYAAAILHADGTEWRWLTAPSSVTGVVALTPGTTVTFAPDQTTAVLTLTPAQSETINATTTNAVKGRIYTLQITTSGTSSYTLTFSTNFKSTGTLATGTTSAKVFEVQFVFDGSTFNEVSRTTAM